jgi:hypothetical protein
MSTSINRPYPPAHLTDQFGPSVFEPSSEILQWMSETIIKPGSILYTADHDHLIDANIGVLLTNIPHRNKGRTVLATAEIFFSRDNAWQKGRQEYQIEQWFGSIPDFIITIYAPWAAKAEDANWCAVVEHELCHCGQKLDKFGFPKFGEDGRPKYAIVGHPVEEFPLVVKKYGLGAVSPEVAELVAAANSKPLISGASVASACGTCLRLV